MVIPPTRSSHELVEGAIGRKWLRAQVRETMKPTPVGRGFTPSTIGLIDQALGHPLVSELYHIEIGRRQTPLRFDLMENCLSNLKDSLSPASLKSRLRDPSGYEKLEYELLAASGYRRYGLRLTPNLARQGPDLVITSQSGDKVWVECKRKDSKTSLEDRMARYRHLVDQPLMDQMKEDGLYCHINFRLLDDPTEIDPQDLVRQVIELCRGRDLASELLFDRIELSIVKLAEDVPEDILNSFITERTIMRSSSVAVKDGELDPSVRSKPIQIQWIIPDDQAGKIRGIENSLREAASQIPQEGPSIVYIDINSHDYFEIHGLLPILSEHVESLLRRTFRRVNYVVLTAVWPALTLNGIEGWGLDLHVVEQPKPRSALPTGIPLLGVTPDFEQLWIHGIWGRPG